MKLQDDLTQENFDLMKELLWKPAFSGSVLLITAPRPQPDDEGNIIYYQAPIFGRRGYISYNDLLGYISTLGMDFYTIEFRGWSRESYPMIEVVSTD